MNKCRRARVERSLGARRYLALAAVGACAIHSPARGDQTKKDNLLALNDPASWLASVPTSTDTAIFDATLLGTTGYTFSLGADQSWGGIRIVDPHSAITIAAGNALTLGAAGIDMSAATRSLTLNNSLLLNASQTWNSATALVVGASLNLGANTLFIGGTGSVTITGPVSGSGGITKNDAGSLTLSGNNNYAGSFTQLAGVTTLTSNSAIGGNTGTLALGGGTLALSAAGTMTLAKSAAISGESEIDVASSLAQFSRNFSGSGTIHWLLDGHGLDLGVFSSIPSFLGFSGTLDFGASDGTIRLLGNSSDMTTDLHFDNTLVDLGTGSAKLITKNPSTQTIGALAGGIHTTLAQGGTGSTTFIIGTLNTASTFAGSILNGTASGAITALTKAGTGTLTLTGTAGNYTGPVAIQGGVLSISSLAGLGAATSSSAAANLIISSSGTPATLQYTGPTASTPRAFIINSAATLDASGSGPLAFSSTSAIAFGTGPAGRTLTLAGTNTALNTFAPQLSDVTSAKTSLIKDGPGAWVLTNPLNAYSGGTSILQGALLVNSNTGTPTGTGDVRVLGGAYGGIGNNISIGSVTVSGGTHLSPGIPGTNSGIGLLHFNNLSLNAASILDLDFSPDGAARDTMSLFNATLTLGASVNVNVYQAGTSLPFALPGSYSIFTGVATLSGDPANDLHVVNGNAGIHYTFSQTGSTILLTIAAAPASSWLGAASTDWSDAGNWSGGIVPGTSAGDVASFGPTAARFTVALNAARRLGGLTFDSGADSGYTLVSGSGGKLILDNGAAPASITLASGTHLISAGVELDTDAAISFSSPATLTLSGAINSGTANSATGLSITGPGKTILSANNSYGGPTAIAAGSILQLGDGHGTGSFGTGPVANSGTILFNRNDTASFPNPLSGTGAIVQAGTGTVTLTGAASYTGLTTISAGRLVFAGAGPHAIASVAGAGTLEAAAPLTSDGVTTAAWQIDSGVTHTIRPNGSATGASVVATLAIAGIPGAWIGTLDLTNNALIIPTSAGTAGKTAVLSTLLDQINEARNNGAWNGAGGITSSTVAASDSQHTLGLALVDNAATHLSTFRGQAVDDSTVIVAPAHVGDANLDGAVTIFDLNTVTSHWQKTTGSLWSDGDFTGADHEPDGRVDIFDLNIVTSYWQFGAGAALQPSAAGLAELAGPSAVPEPATLSLLALGAALLLRRQKSRLRIRDC